MLIDIGANLTNRSFAGDLEQVLTRARAAGLETIVVTGTSVEGSRQALEVAKEHPDILRCTAGVHPHDASSCDATTLEQLQLLAKNPQVVALGECGLDYNRDFSPRPTQLEWFEAQVTLAVEMGKPLFLHERDAHGAFVEVVRRHRTDLTGVVVHCFTGGETALRAYLDLDLHIGITGWICDERRGQQLQDMVKDIPTERLMLETDSPYLLPRSRPKRQEPRARGRRNEPAFLPHIAATVAALTGKSVDQVGEETSRTARLFFDL